MAYLLITHIILFEKVCKRPLPCFFPYTNTAILCYKIEYGDTGI